MRKTLLLLLAALLLACAEQSTQPEVDPYPQSANRSAVGDTDLDGFTVSAGDCDDSNPEIHPRKAEIPGNGIDDDCNAGTADVSVLVAPTTATFDSGHSHAEIIADGTTYNGLKFETDHDLGMYYDSNKGNGGSNCLYDNAVDPGDVLWLSITKTDFSDFRFDSIWIGATAGNNTLTVRGYLDDVEVENSDIDVSFDGTHTFDWSRVDEVRFEAETDLFSCFDDFTYTSYGATATDAGPAPVVEVAAPVIGVDSDLDGFTVDAGDCDDSNPEINPGKAEFPGNGIDDDCNPGTADLAVLGTLTADFDTGHKHADIIADGTTYNGLKFETDNDWGMYYDGNKGNGGSKCLYDNAVDPGDVLWLSITKTDFSDFRFDSIWIGATAGNNTLTVRGYLDDVEVEIADIDISFDGAHTFDWSRVDEVRFEAETDLFSCFDDFTYTSFAP